MKKWSGFHIRWNKKVWTLFGVALLLCGAVVANIIIGNSADGQAGEQPSAEQGGEDVVSTGASSTQNFFAAFRADRDTTRERRSITLTRSSNRAPTRRHSPTHSSKSWILSTTWRKS